MRVILISVGLMVVFAVATFVWIEPEVGGPQLASQTVVDNPFADDKEVNDANDSVNLVVLPSESKENPASVDQSPEVANVSQNITENASGDIENNVSQNAGQQPVAEPAVEGVVNTEQIAANKPKKKLGLAMLAFEKEKKKNMLAVIVHESNSQKLTEKEIKALYMDRLTRWRDGSKVMLYNLPLGDKYRDMFSNNILKMTALEADAAESKRRQLRINANDAEVKAKNVVVSYVEQHPNAVAYVPLSLVREKSNVKVVLTIP